MQIAYCQKKKYCQVLGVFKSACESACQSKYYKEIFKVEIFQGRNIRLDHRSQRIVGSNPILNSEFFGVDVSTLKNF